MKILTSTVLLTLALVGCTRNDQAGEVASDTATTPAADTPAATMPADTSTAGTMPPASTTGACQGLTGQALTDCMNQSAGATTGQATDPTMTGSDATGTDTGTGTDTQNQQDTQNQDTTDATTPPSS